MSIYLWLLSGICAITIVVDLLLIYFWSFHRKDFKNHHQPFVSILIAARNEEDNIEKCINAILNVDYPKDKIEILIGDDQSDDKTSEIIQSNYGHLDNLTLKNITENLGKAKGKANVLAHLAKSAKGSVFLITDADVIVPKRWISSMLEGLSKNVGIVNGFTVVSDNKYQNLDWILALGMVKVITDLVKPVTAMGNNMLVTKEAYESVGGYESIPFSITEDFELFKQISKRGFKTRQLVNESVTAFTKGKSSFWELMHQRKRWMKGAAQLPLPIVSILFAQAIYYPAIILLFFFNLQVASSVAMTKILLQSFFIVMVASQINQRVSFLNSILFELYSLLIAISTVLFYILPIKIIWKGRKY